MSLWNTSVDTLPQNEQLETNAATTSSKIEETKSAETLIPKQSKWKTIGAKLKDARADTQSSPEEIPQLAHIVAKVKIQQVK